MDSVHTCKLFEKSLTKNFKSGDCVTARVRTKCGRFSKNTLNRITKIFYYGGYIMLFLYFSGTGNSKYISELFCKKTSCNLYSIEDNVDFDNLINQHETIGFCYPIYGSRMPRIMREFITKHKKTVRGKKVIIFCTQWLFSGDGARSFVDVFPKNYFDVIYAEHFFMPNNICNFSPLPVTNGNKNDKYLRKANRKMNKVCKDIKNGVVFRRGFNPISRLLGSVQGGSVPLLEKRCRSSVKIRGNCNRCGKCIKVCPMKNLRNVNDKMKQKSNCTFCYRCVNSCPQKSITAFLHGKVKRQYKGL